MTPGAVKMATDVIRKAGLDPNDFCMVRNQCFLSEQNPRREFSAPTASSGKTRASPSPSFSYSLPPVIAATGNCISIDR